nr:hypothetical protein [Streptococcus oralis]
MGLAFASLAAFVLRKKD